MSQVELYAFFEKEGFGITSSDGTAKSFASVTPQGKALLESKGEDTSLITNSIYKGDLHQSPPPCFSLQDAVVEAERRVNLLPVGAEFTSMGLFGNIRIRGSQRRRAALLVGLRSAGRIVTAGFTQMDQEERNNGVATLWRKVK